MASAFRRLVRGRFAGSFSDLVWSFFEKCLLRVPRVRASLFWVQTLGGQEDKGNAEVKFKQISEAYCTLQDWGLACSIRLNVSRSCTWQ